MMNWYYISIILLVIIFLFLILVVVITYKYIKLISKNDVVADISQIKKPKNLDDKFFSKPEKKELQATKSAIKNKEGNNQKEFYNNEINNDSALNKIIHGNDFENVLKRVSEKYINDKVKIDKIISYVRNGNKTNSKFFLTVEDFKSAEGLFVILNLLSWAKTDMSVSISNAEKQSWLANFGPLKRLFFNEYNDVGKNEKTWLVFEQKIEYCADKTKFIRPDLLIIAKSGGTINIVVLELKQWSDEYILRQKVDNSKTKSEPLERLNIMKQLARYSGCIEKKNTNLSLKILNLGYLFNASDNGVKLLNEMFPNERTLISNVYSFNGMNNLSNRIWAFLKNQGQLDNLESNDLISVLKDISNFN